MLTGANGKSYNLESKPFSSGGEGDIYGIRGDQSRVVKIYHADRITAELEQKIRLMAKNPPSDSILKQVAWPLDVVSDGASGFRGFVMPRLNVNAELGEVYAYPPKTNITYQQKLIVAQNICLVISEVHAAGYIFGDFNPRNIGINLNTGNVAFLDTDSYHIVVDKNAGKAYRCSVCAAGYVAPELLEKCNAYKLKHPEAKDHIFEKVPLDTFTKETDNFALAIHMFKLLMNGYSPFEGIKDNETASTATTGVGNEAVHRDSYCFKLGNKPRAAAVPPLSILPKEIAGLFFDAFISGRKDPSRRPSAAEWYKALNDYESSLTTCSKNPAHMYLKTLKRCPWCEADQRYKAKMAPSPAQKAFTAPVKPVMAPPPVVTPPPSVTPSPAAAAYVQPQFQSTSAKKRDYSALFTAIGWFALLGSIVYLLLPFISGGSIHITGDAALRLNVARCCAAALLGVWALGFFTNLSGSGSADFAFILSWILGVPFCFMAATLRYTRMGYNASSAGRTWMIFGILLMSFIWAVFFSSNAGKQLHSGEHRQYASTYVNQKRKYSAGEVIFLVLMIACSVICEFALFNSVRFYSGIQKYNLLKGAILFLPFLIVVLYSANKFKSAVIRDCFCVSVAAFLQCVHLWVVSESGSKAVFFWFLITIITIIFLNCVVNDIGSGIAALTGVTMFISWFGIAFGRFQVANESAEMSVVFVRRWAAIPMLILIGAAAVATINNVSKGR